MLLEPKDRAAAVFQLVATNTLKDAEAIMQGMGEHVDVGLIPGDEFTVEPNLIDLIDHAALIA